MISYEDLLVDRPEIEETAISYRIKWVMPTDKSKLFWEITDADNPKEKQYASKLEFEVPSKADYNRIYATGHLYIDKDKVAHFYGSNKEEI